MGFRTRAIKSLWQPIRRKRVLLSCYNTKTYIMNHYSSFKVLSNIVSCCKITRWPLVIMWLVFFLPRHVWHTAKCSIPHEGCKSLLGIGQHNTRSRIMACLSTFFAILCLCLGRLRQWNFVTFMMLFPRLGILLLTMSCSHLTSLASHFAFLATMTCFILLYQDSASSSNCMSALFTVRRASWARAFFLKNPLSGDSGRRLEPCNILRWSSGAPASKRWHEGL